MTTVQELEGVEKHLLQAKASLLAEEERALAEHNTACHGYGDLGIPKGGFQPFVLGVSCCHFSRDPLIPLHIGDKQCDIY